MWKKWSEISLVKRIVCGLILGVVLALIAPVQLRFLTIFGELFVNSLRAIAPILVLFLVIAAISQHKIGQKTNISTIVVLYLVGTFLAAVVAVIASFLFPVTLTLVADKAIAETPPQDVVEVLRHLLFNIVDNPINAILSANYIGILAFAVLFGIALKSASESTKVLVNDCAKGIAQIVKWIINLAPFGVMGLVFKTVATSGFKGLQDYAMLLSLLVGTMIFIALVVNPLISYIMIRQNPYKLVFKCLRYSGITAFFTRSSAANIPVNMNLCEEMGLDKDTYSVSIPLGATINMAGAAVTITILTLATVHTLGMNVDIPTAIILSILSAVSACGASGIAGGSLLLIPLAASLFGVSNEIAMEVVGVGFIIGVVQDSCETALNSSTDVLFTAITEYSKRKKEGKTIVM